MGLSAPQFGESCFKNHDTNLLGQARGEIQQMFILTLDGIMAQLPFS